MIVTDGNGYKIRAPKLCRIPDCKDRPCGEIAIGRCTVDVSWPVCEYHFEVCRHNGFGPLTWTEIVHRREAVMKRVGQVNGAQTHYRTQDANGSEPLA